MIFIKKNLKNANFCKIMQNNIIYEKLNTKLK